VYALGAKTGKIVAAKELLPGDDLIVINSSGESIRLIGDEIPMRGRGEPGEPLVRVRRGESIVEVARVAARNAERGSQDASGTEAVDILDGDSAQGGAAASDSDDEATVGDEEVGATTGGA